MPKRKRTQPEPPAAELQDEEAPVPPPSIFNTSYATLRVSPLYIGPESLDASRLQILSKRLRETLVGDVVRGVQIGLDPDQNLGKAGALEAVEWRWVKVKELLKDPRAREGSAELGELDGGEGGESEDEGDIGDANEALGDLNPWRKRRKEALTIELHYESATYTALLMPDLSGTALLSMDAQTWTSHPSIPLTDATPDSRSFAHLPLLLLRMPAPLKPIITDFICRTFDCRMSNLQLGTRTLTQTLEAWILDTRQNARKPKKEVFLSLGFDLSKSSASQPHHDTAAKEEALEQNDKSSIEAGLKSIDVIIPAEDVIRFASVKTSENRIQGYASAAKSPEEGWAWKTAQNIPFTEAVAQYIDHHLALNLFNPSVRVMRIACDGFVLGNGRVKIFAPAVSRSCEEVALQLVTTLVERAKGYMF